MKAFVLAQVSGFCLAVAAGSTPANAALQIAIDVGGGPAFTCVDQAACDLNPAIGVLQIGETTIDGVELNGSIQFSGRSPNVLSTSSLFIHNTAGVARTGEAVVSDTDFIGPVSELSLSGAGTWSLAGGSTTTNRWFADAANGQGGGPGLLTPGTLLDTFSSTALGPADSYSHDALEPFAAAGPFSMTEQVDLTLTPGAFLVNRGQTMTAVPEPSTWAMIALGFGVLSIAAGRRRPRQARHA
jgi:hypothetical protein